AEPEVVEAEGGEIRVPGCFDAFARAGVSVDDDGDRDDVGSGFFEGGDGGEGGASGRGGVFDDDDAAPGDIRSFDLSAAAVIFGFFAYDEGVEAEPAQCAAVEDGGGDGVGAHGESADGVNLWDV